MVMAERFCLSCSRADIVDLRSYVVNTPGFGRCPLIVPEGRVGLDNRAGGIMLMEQPDHKDGRRNGTMLDRLDLFEFYRWLLAIVCAVYTVVQVARSLWVWLAWFGSSRQTAVLGRYTAVLLLRLRLRRFARDLGQIVVLLAMLAGVLYLHRWVGPAT